MEPDSSKPMARWSFSGGWLRLWFFFFPGVGPFLEGFEGRPRGKPRILDVYVYIYIYIYQEHLLTMAHMALKLAWLERPTVVAGALTPT